VWRPDDVRGLLLEVRAKSVPAGATLPSGSGFEVSVEPIVPGPNGTVRLCLALADGRYEEVFGVLADDVAAAVGAEASEAASVNVFIGRLNTWQRFLRRHGDRLLSEEARVGLFGELLQVSELLGAGAVAGDVVAAWRGPSGGAQDFALGGCALEVKTTASAHPTSFEVSNLVQLDERPLPMLLVRQVVLRPAAAGRTLPALVDEVRQIIRGQDAGTLQAFDDALMDAGYLDAHRREYEANSYVVRADHYFRVEGAFPRVRADDVRPGVRACSYSVEVAACLPFEIGADQAWRAIRDERDE
jgi:hypothetical protein